MVSGRLWSASEPKEPRADRCVVGVGRALRDAQKCGAERFAVQGSVPMVALLTPFSATAVLPLQDVDLELLGDEWTIGPFRAPGTLEALRTSSYPDRTSIQALLDPSRRRVHTASHSTEQLVLESAEVVLHDRDWTPIRGHLLLHLASAPTASASAAPTQLGQVVRPGTVTSAELISALPDAGAFTLGEAIRGGSICLSGVPSAGEEALVRWEGQDQLQGRLTDLVVLRRDSATVARPFELDVDHPTPSYLLTGSGMALAVGRLRAVSKDHIQRLRTFWTDAYLLELAQFEELQELATQLRSLGDQRGSDWRQAALKFRRYRTRAVWAASSDRTMEGAVSVRIRQQLGTDELVSRIQAELDDHSRAAQTRSAETLNVVLLALTLATIVLPLFLSVTNPDWHRSAKVIAWLIGFATTSGVVGVIVHDRLRVRR